VFLGGLGGSPVEEMVAAACRAAAQDSLERALSTGAFAGAIVVSDTPLVLEGLPTGVHLEVDDGPFQFGQRLADIVARYGLEKVVYLGGGALPLFSADEFIGLAQGLAVEDQIVITNNYYSADLVAFRPASAVASIPFPERDNQLARLLAEAVGMSLRSLPRTVSTVFDIDGPTDLAVLALTGLGGPRLGGLLKPLEMDLSRFRAALAVFTDARAQLLVAGRVGSHVWQYLERETACRVRLLAEERGMQADGRMEAGQVRSLLGFYLAEVGPGPVFAALAELSDVAVMDTRVLLAHLGIVASRRDRFLSDLGRPREIAEPFLSRFTQAALAAPIPVLMGGHSLVSGGLMALIDFAWREHDRALEG
jgi:hypothetical protein